MRRTATSKVNSPIPESLSGLRGDAERLSDETDEGHEIDVGLDEIIEEKNV
jgi:hypothetical protein